MRLFVLTCANDIAMFVWQDFHRKLEIEKTERCQSDSRALQLLEEVREQGRIAKQLRESEAT